MRSSAHPARWENRRSLVPRREVDARPRAAMAWVVLWAVYTLAMLGYLAHDAAWAATVCSVQ